MKDILIKIVKCLLPLLGIAMFDSCRVEYGCPYSDFEAKGTVADEDGIPYTEFSDKENAK